MLRLCAMNNASKLSNTDLCVMCGMCLPLCPTYQLYQTETESPRGRIALMQAIDRKQIKADAKALLHIDHCLGCLNCETICPSRVPYGELIDEFREQFNESIKKPFLSKLILKQAAKNNGLNKLASFTNKPVLKQLVKISSDIGITPINSLTTAPKLKNFYASESDNNRGEVSLFTGCISETSEHSYINDAIYILNLLNFDVSISEQQVCCGALHQHNGQQKTAEKLFRQSHSLLRKSNDKPVLFFSPACGAHLLKGHDLNAMDARSFILKEIKQQSLEFSKPAQAVALHESCSHQNMLKLKTLNTDLLKCIPGIEIIKSLKPSLCCGAGGLQSINYPRQAQSLLQEKIESFDLTQTDILISDNIGCSLHIKTAVSEYNSRIEVIHPISFLARQLTNTTKK